MTLLNTLATVMTGFGYLIINFFGHGTLPALPAGKWHAQLTDKAAAWRLSGVLHTPFSQSAKLSAGAGGCSDFRSSRRRQRPKGRKLRPAMLRPPRCARNSRTCYGCRRE